jgi:ubiquinol-cytochrome c reductase cytochrome c1 subunit
MINFSSAARRAAGALVLAAAATSALTARPSPAVAAGDIIKYDRQSWTYAGFPLIGRGGYYDNNQLQRGFLVYKEVCSSCHGMKHIAFRNLAQPGGPEFPEAGVKSLAASYQIVDGPNDQGKMFKRPGLLSDRMPSPFSNEQEARSANNGALPPDLSIITKARGIEVERPFYMMPFAVLRDVFSGYQEAGSDYVYALLNGYVDAPLYKQDGSKLVALPPLKKGERKPQGALECASITKGEAGKPDQCNVMQPGMNYNTHFAGYQIGMSAPLSDGQVKYTDDTPPTLANYAKDVTAFLAWSSDPNLESRKKAGVIAIGYLLLTALLMYFAKKRVWSRIGH